MRFATIQSPTGPEFVLGLRAGNYVRWKDYVNLFPNDKLISQTRTLLDFVKVSRLLLDHVRKNLDRLNSLPAIQVKPADYALPFTPVMFRDFYCFEEHVKNARKGRGADMLPEWYEAPIFYYSNHLSFRGPFEEIPFPQGSEEMDLELEIAAVVGRELRNASLEEAREAIFGYTLVNDWTARDFQRFEMKINMGPTKGKDFATSFGSFIITPDELESKRSGKGYDLEFSAEIGGELLTKKNWKGIQFSFEEMLVRASKNCTVYPGEVIASGTMGLGCLMEHNIGKDQKRWLNKGETVTLRWLPDGPMISNRIGEPK
jgi:2-keto-4-pentenoate hydratase/2-oxohepta-3-ene-1,7-dioic acid hydratase in catechol pathway